MKTVSVLFILGSLAFAPSARADPACAGPNHWAANMVQGQLKNAGVFSNDQIDFERVSSKLLLSQKIGPDLYRQAFLVTFPLKTGDQERAIAISNASSEECSMGEVTVYRLAKTAK